MSKLVEELKKDHAVIVDVLNKIKETGVSSKEGQNLLTSAKSGLLAHLKKEDVQLYPVLNKAAESDDSLKRSLDVFATDMQNISKAALEFFDKYSGGGSGYEFAKDFGRLLAALSKRITTEENVIYKKFDELN